MLIDVWRRLGLEGIAQVDLDEHRNPHQPLSALTPMAATVLATIAARLRARGPPARASRRCPDRARRRSRAWRAV